MEDGLTTGTHPQQYPSTAQTPVCIPDWGQMDMFHNPSRTQLPRRRQYQRHRARHVHRLILGPQPGHPAPLAASAPRRGCPAEPFGPPLLPRHPAAPDESGLASSWWRDQSARGSCRKSVLRCRGECYPENDLRGETLVPVQHSEPAGPAGTAPRALPCPPAPIAMRSALEMSRESSGVPSDRGSSLVLLHVQSDWQAHHQPNHPMLCHQLVQPAHILGQAGPLVDLQRESDPIACRRPGVSGGGGGGLGMGLGEGACTLPSPRMA